jgi:hypothetical protein
MAPVRRDKGELLSPDAELHFAIVTTVRNDVLANRSRFASTIRFCLFNPPVQGVAVVGTFNQYSLAVQIELFHRHCGVPESPGPGSSRTAWYPSYGMKRSGRNTWGEKNAWSARFSLAQLCRVAPWWSDAERFMPHSVPAGKCPVRLSGSLGERAYAEFEIVCESNLVKGQICSKICQI